MTGQERLLASVEHSEPDRVPLCMDAEAEVFIALGEALRLDTREDILARLHIDQRLIGPVVTDPRARDTSETERMSQWGYTVRRAKTAYGSYGLICNEPLKDQVPELETIERHDWPDPELLEFSHWPDIMAEHDEPAFIGHITHGPYFNCTYLRGLQEYLMDMVLHPEFARTLMARAEDYLQAGLDKLLVEGGERLDVFYMADDYCQHSGPLFDPTLFRETVKPYLSRIADKVHRAGKKFLLHVCGGVRPILPDIIEAGVDMLEPVQTTAAGMDLPLLKKDFGADITFYGSIDTIEILPKGTPERVADSVKQTLDTMAPGGGFVLGPSHTYIQPDTPVENILAMYDTAVDYGRY
jgi:uroporphyrinogen decarboxylase